MLQVYYSFGREVSSDESIETEAFSLIVMEDVSDRFQQSCSMDRSRAMSLMEALATLHSHYWGKVDQRERGSFWTMERRKPKKGEWTVCSSTTNRLHVGQMLLDN